MVIINRRVSFFIVRIRIISYFHFLPFKMVFFEFFSNIFYFIDPDI